MDKSGLYDIENYVASEVHVKRFTSKEVGIKKLEEAFLFLCADGRSSKTSNLTPRTRHERVETAGGYPQLWARRDAQGVTLLQEEGEVADVSEVARLWKLGMMSGVQLVNLSFATTLCPENNCMHRKNRHSHSGFFQNTLTS